MSGGLSGGRADSLVPLLSGEQYSNPFLWGGFKIRSSWMKWPRWFSLFSRGISSVQPQTTPTYSSLRKKMTWKWNLCKHPLSSFPSLPPPHWEQCGLSGSRLLPQGWALCVSVQEMDTQAPGFALYSIRQASLALFRGSRTSIL